MTLMRVALAQFEATADKNRNRRLVVDLATQAAKAGARLCLFPEESMVSLPSGLAPRDTAEPLDGPFVAQLRSLAAEQRMVIAAGMHEQVGDGDRPYNTIVLIRDDGALWHTYRKLHVYDAFGYRESAYILPGDAPPVTFDLGPFRFGLINCYDVRFPELTRLLVDDQADVILVPAAWQRGPLKEDHWRTLLRARAIENTCWVLGASQAGEQCTGLTMVVDPLGIVRGQLGEERQALLVHDLDTDRVSAGRRLLPGIHQRRLRIDPTIVPHVGSEGDDPHAQQSKPSTTGHTAGG